MEAQQTKFGKVEKREMLPFRKNSDTENNHGD
jgi:hypothetical protein